MVVDVGHDAIRRCHDGISRFAVSIPLNALDVQAFVHLPTIGSNAAESPADPGLSRRRHEVTLLAAFFEYRMIRRRQLERLTRRRQTDGDADDARKYFRMKDKGSRLTTDTCPPVLTPR